MRQFLLQTVVSAVIAIALVHYVPLSWIDQLPSWTKPLFGATSITTIQGTDTISGSRTTINNNFSSLNSNKVEISDLAATTSLGQLTTTANLSTVGTISTGIWHGTAVTVPFGGTGSTTLSSNQVLIGNGSGNLNTVIGYGTSGQVLTSNGVAAAPTWQSITFDTSLSYTTTGQWTMASDTIYTLNTGTFVASTSVRLPSSINWAGIAYTAPSSQGAANSFLQNNGSGALSWTTSIPGSQYSVSSTSAAVITTNNAAYPSSGIIVPASTMTASTTITYIGSLQCIANGGGSAQCSAVLTDANSDDFLTVTLSPTVSQTCSAIFTATVTANNSTGSQLASFNGVQICGSVVTLISGANTTSATLSNSQTFRIRLTTGSSNTSSATLNPFSIVVRP